MNQAQLDEIFTAYSSIRRKIRELEVQQDYLKDVLHELLDDTQSNVLNTPNFNLLRTFVERDVIRRQNLPANVWEAYKETITYPSLHLRPL